MNDTNNVVQSHILGQQTHSNDTHNAESSRQRGQNRAVCEEDKIEICDEDVENFLENEEASSQGQNDYTIDKNQIPETGMQFETREKAQNFFNTYAFAAGFSVTIVSLARTTSRKSNREVIRVTMKCNKYGSNTPQEKE